MKALIGPAFILRRRAWFTYHRSRFVVSKSQQRRPRLLVDLSVISRHDAETGIQRVVRAIWNVLRRIKHPTHDIIPVYAGASHGYCFLDLCSETKVGRQTGRVVGASSDDIFLGLDLAAHYLPHCAEQLSSWRHAGVTIATVVYDLLPLEKPAWFNSRTQKVFAQWFKVIGQHSDQLFCISDAVAKQVSSKLVSGSRPNIARLWLSGDIAGSGPSQGLTPDTLQTLETMRKRPAILMVGTVEPRKGHDVALSAFEHLWSDATNNLTFVMVGKPGWKTGELQDRIRKHPEFGQRLIWLSVASDQALVELYAHSRGVLLPSRGEGLGLPLLEALTALRPVLARGLPVFREQRFSGLTFFDDDRPGPLSLAIRRLADQPPLCPEVNRLPTWADCTADLLNQLGMGQKAHSAPVTIHSAG